MRSRSFPRKVGIHPYTVAIGKGGITGPSDRSRERDFFRTGVPDVPVAETGEYTQRSQDGKCSKCSRCAAFAA
ncbi:MAG: hypothetical protein ACRC46_13090 [Thermoguttaceae bacterium]